MGIFHGHQPYRILCRVASQRDAARRRDLSSRREFTTIRDEHVGLLEKLVGESAYERVAIVSTKWDRLTNPALSTKLITQRALPGGVWHSLCEGGAVVLHHDNTKNSADDIIRYLVGRFSSQRTQLLIQQELIEHYGKISLTSVGKELERQDAEALTIRAEVL